MGEDLQHVYTYFKNVEKQSLFALLLILFIIVMFLVSLFIRFLYHQGSLPGLLITTTPLIYSRNNNVVVLPCPSLGLDIEQINSLPIFAHKLAGSSDDKCSSSNNTTNNKDSFMESECSICLGTFEDEEILKLMPECLHVFHSECVDKWLSSSSTCPLCRSSI